MYLILKNINLRSIEIFSKILEYYTIKNFFRKIIGIILPIFIIVIWYLLTKTETIRNNLLPAPEEVINEIFTLASDGTLLTHILLH